jgi:ABC-type glycerol-3-phosphate transport system substrate-binding protein
VSKRFVALLAALAALALIVAGCGGGSDSTESTSSLSKAEFVKKGNAICAKGNEEIEEGFEEFGKEHGFSEEKEPSKAELEEAVETIVIPGVRKQVEGIRALGPPDQAAEAILDAAEEGLEKGEEDPKQFLKEESAGPFAKANKLSREYGLTKCGEEEG